MEQWVQAVRCVARIGSQGNKDSYAHPKRVHTSMAMCGPACGLKGKSLKRSSRLRQAGREKEDRGRRQAGPRQNRRSWCRKEEPPHEG